MRPVSTTILALGLLCLQGCFPPDPVVTCTTDTPLIDEEFSCEVTLEGECTVSSDSNTWSWEGDDDALEPLDGLGAFPLVGPSQMNLAFRQVDGADLAVEVDVTCPRFFTDVYDRSLYLSSWEEPDATEPPVACMSVTPNPAVAGENVSLDAGCSTDPDGTLVEYAWDFEGDGAWDVVGAPDDGGFVVWTSMVYEAGTWEVTLRVTDDDGISDTTSETLTVE